MLVKQESIYLDAVKQSSTIASNSKSCNEAYFQHCRWAANENVWHGTHPMPKVNTALAQLTGATMFSKLDINSGFWQIPLAPESRLLTTFITQYSRFCFNKSPFGTSSALEMFQWQKSDILSDLPGVLCHVDGIVVFGSTPEVHDSRLRAVLERIKAAGVILNREKCQFS